VSHVTPWWRPAEADAQGLLSDLRVVDLSVDVAGPYASKLLAGLGADVLKVEPPEGDVARRRGPFLNDAPNVEASAPFLYLNTGKRSVTLDLAVDVGRRALLGLLDGADVLIESYGAGGLEMRGIDPTELRARYPRLIVLRLSDFGQTGPYLAYRGEDIVLQALGGLLYLTGDPDRPPLRVGGRQAYYLAGLNAFVALAAALFQRERDDTGVVVDLSVLECIPGVLETATYRYVTQGQIAQRDGNWANRAAWGVYPCADGYAAVVSGDGLMFRRMGRIVPALANPRYDSFEQRRAHADDINAELLPWLMAHTKEEVYAAGQRERLPFGAVRSIDDLLNAEQLRARGFFEQIEHPEAGVQRYPCAPFRLQRHPWQSGRAPLLGEHQADIEGAAFRARPPRSEQATEERVRALPLAGVRVLDLTMVWAGPFATKFLADLGAEVIKIESLAHVDSRVWAGLLSADVDPEHPPYTRDAYVILYGRNKLGLTLDLASTAGKALFLQLVAISDVVIENFSFGVMDRLGLDDATLRTINPSIIVATMPGFGNSGPDREHIAYGTTLEALSGLTGLTGYTADEPHKSGINYGDPVAGLHTAGAVITALGRARRTGVGEQIEVAQLESLVILLGEAVLDCSMNGRSAHPLGNRARGVAPQGVYPCARPTATDSTDDAWIAISVTSDLEWQRLVQAMGSPAWAGDPALASLSGRVAQSDAIDTYIADWTRLHDQRPLMERLQAVGVCAGAVLNIAQVLCDPHLTSRGLFTCVDHPDGNSYALTLNPWTFDGLRHGVQRPAPALGQDNDYILHDLLGVSREHLDALADQHLIGKVPLVGE